MAKTDDSALKPFERLVGVWMTEATHPAMPGVTVHGTVTVEWLEGEKFLIHRGRTDHKDFPDAIWIMGDIGQDRVDDSTKKTSGGADKTKLRAHYFDSRGVFRDYETTIDDTAWRWQRIVPGFSQRFTGTFSSDSNTIDGISQLCKDDTNWVDDLKIIYRRDPR